MANRISAGLHAIGVSGEHGAGAVDHRAQRQVSGFSLCHSIHRAVWPIRLAGRLQFKRRARAMAFAIFPQSDGRCDRRISLVHPGRSKPALPAGSGGKLLRHGLLPVVWHRRFRKMEKSFAD